MKERKKTTRHLLCCFCPFSATSSTEMKFYTNFILGQMSNVGYRPLSQCISHDIENEYESRPRHGDYLPHPILGLLVLLYSREYLFLAD